MTKKEKIKEMIANLKDALKEAWKDGERNLRKIGVILIGIAIVLLIYALAIVVGIACWSTLVWLVYGKLVAPAFCLVALTRFQYIAIGTVLYVISKILKSSKPKNYNHNRREISY